MLVAISHLLLQNIFVRKDGRTWPASEITSVFEQRQCLGCLVGDHLKNRQIETIPEKIKSLLLQSLPLAGDHH